MDGRSLVRLDVDCVRESDRCRCIRVFDRDRVDRHAAVYLDRCRVLDTVERCRIRTVKRVIDFRTARDRQRDRLSIRERSWSW